MTVPRGSSSLFLSIAMPQTTQPIESCLWPQLDSPSFFNPVEASKIAELVEALLSSRRVQCKTSDIGIISAFRKQVVKLRAMLRAKGLGAINTGQVEDFQGQEQKVSVGTSD